MRDAGRAVRSGRIAGAALVDGVLLAGLLHAGWSWRDAQLVAFLGGLLTLVVLSLLTRRPPGDTRTLSPRLFTEAAAAVLALTVRGGALATLLRLGLDTGPWIVGAALLTWPLLEGLRRGIPGTWDVHGRGGDGAVVRLAATFTAVSVLVRVVFLMPIELMHEEAYYWLLARHLDYGYLDHPPFVAAMIWAGTWIAGDTELGVRLFAPVLWAGGAAFVFALTRRIFDRVTAWVAVAVFAALPFFFSAGMLAFPDTPLIFCWAGSVYFLYRMLVEDAPRAWLGVGTFLGLGLLAKYSIGLLGLAALLFAVAHPRARPHFARWSSYAAILVALLVFSPVLLWNASHEWASFRYQTTGRITNDFHFMLPKLLLFIGVHLMPIGLVGVWLSLRRWWRGRSAPATGQDAPTQRALQLMVWLTLVPLSVFVFASLFRVTKFNWTAPVWIPLLPFLATALLRPAVLLGEEPGRVIEKHTARFALGMLVVFALGLYHFGLGWPGVPYPREASGIGWRGLGARLEAMAEARRPPAADSRPLVVGMDDDTTPAWIAFYRCAAAGPKSGDRAVAETRGGNLFDEPCGMLAYWYPVEPPPLVLDELLVVSDEAERLDRPRILSRVERAGPILELPREKNGRAAGVHYARWVYGYRSH